MARRLVLLVVVLLLVIGGVSYWRQHQIARSLDSGAVTCVGCMTPDQAARFDREDHGETVDGNSEHKTDLSRTLSPTPSPNETGAQPSGNSVESFPPSNGSATTPSLVAAQTPLQGAAAPITSTAPAADSIRPNPPNGMAFTGTGQYQWYRQGNLTWRVNTSTGSSCIAYATMEEWRKPIVIRHGCGNA